MSTDRYDLQTAAGNVGRLTANSYPGRGILIGRTGAQDVVLMCWLTGRKESTRNRVYKEEESTGRVFTEAQDPAKVTDTANLFYNAMLERNFGDETLHIIGNGNQTDEVYNSPCPSLSIALQTQTFEQDDNYTPRITGLFSYPTVRKGFDITGTIQFHVVRRAHRNTRDRLHFWYDSIPGGIGFYLTTYMGDGTPPPSWVGEPRPIPIGGTTAEEIAEEFWNYLDHQQRAAIVVKLITPDGKVKVKIINKREQVSPMSVPADTREFLEGAGQKGVHVTGRNDGV